MAFTTTVTARSVIGDKVMVTGTYTNAASSTGGDIPTGLKRVEAITLTPKGTAISANQSVVNETLPLDSGDVTIVTTADEVGSWVAIGY